jgi:DNA-binding XRE family transcriptional regulator
VASQVGVDVPGKTINTVENCVFIPSVLLALTLARALGTSVETLFYLIDDREIPAAQRASMKH